MSPKSCCSYFKKSVLFNGMTKFLNGSFLEKSRKTFLQFDLRKRRKLRQHIENLPKLLSVINNLSITDITIKKLRFIDYLKLSVSPKAF